MELNLIHRYIHLTPLSANWRIEGGRDLEITGPVSLPGPGRITLGKGVRLLAHRGPIELRAHEGGEIRIDDGAVIEGGTSIEATQLVHIGARVRIGRFCKIIDNHFHRMVGDRFERPEGVAVIIGHDAIIGPRTIVLPGAEVGPGAWVGPATVLSIRLPAGIEFPGRPNSLAPDGLAPDGSVPDGFAPDGLAPDGSVPDGLARVA